MITELSQNEIVQPLVSNQNRIKMDLFYSNEWKNIILYFQREKGWNNLIH